MPLALQPINPLNTTAMHFWDGGDVESPDGRSHPVTSQTPVSVNIPTQVLPGPIPMVIPGTGVVNAIDKATSILPAHFGARLAVGVVAVGILLIVAFKIAK